MRPLTRLFICADDACACFRGRPRQAPAQSDDLQDRHLFVGLHRKAARSLNLSHHIHNSRAQDFDDVAGVDHGILMSAGGIEKVLQVHRDDVFGRECVLVNIVSGRVSFDCVFFRRG